MAATSSDFNLQKVSTVDLTDNIRATIEQEGNIAIFGRRGSGKTYISKAEIARSNHKEIYLNCSVFERVDLGGYPNFHTAAEGKKKYIDFLLPQFYENLIENKEPCVLLLDEVDKADPSVWAPLLEITQFHTMNGRQLPNLKAVIMTGNLQAEGGQRPSLPLLDRAEKYLVESDVSQWLDWAARCGQIHPSITAFINDHQEDLFGDVDPGEIYADPSPRGWHNASNIVNFGEAHKWNGKVLTTKVAGCVGKKVGLKYDQYFQHYQVLLPLIDKVFAGEPIKDFKKLEPTKQIVACMIICSRFARLIDKCEENERPKETKVVAKFMKDVDSEMTLISVRSQIGLQRVVSHGLDEDPGWDEILRNISDKMQAA